MKKVRREVARYQNQISRAYNKKVEPRALKVGDLVFKAPRHISKGVKYFQVRS